MRVDIVPPKPAKVEVAHGKGFINLYLRGDTLSPGECLYSTRANAQNATDEPDGKKGRRQYIKTVEVLF